MPKNAQAEQADSFDRLEHMAADVIQGIPEGEGGEIEQEGAPAAPVAATPLPGTPAAAPTPQFRELEPPKIWPEPAKAAWKALHGNPEARAHLEQVHGVVDRTQSYVTQIEKQNALYRNNFEPLGQFLAPYAQQWAAEGMDVQQGLRQIMTFRDQLIQNPEATLLQLAQRFGVDLAKALDQTEYIDPVAAQMQQIKAENDQRWRQFELQQQQQYQQQTQQYVLSNVQAFEQEKDAQGNLKHPHFGTVLNHMQALVTMGHATDAESAYALAVQLNPTLQAQAAKDAAAEAVRKTQAANAQVTQTVARGGVPRTRPDRGSTNERPSMDDIIREEMAKSQP